MEAKNDGFLKGESMTWLMLVAETWDWQGFLIISAAELDGGSRVVAMAHKSIIG